MKCHTCLIFHQPSLTLDPDCGFAYLETALSFLSMTCQYQQHLNRNQPNLVTSYQDGSCKISYFTEGQAGKRAI